MADQRRDGVTRDVLQRLVDEAAGKAAKEGGRMGALEVLNSLSVHDMMDKAGQEAFRADATWANRNRVRCEKVQDRAFWYGLGVVALIIGGAGLANWEYIKVIMGIVR